MEENKFEKFYKEVFPFWADLPEAEKNFVCDSSFEINYKKGTQIHDGSECSGVFMVQSGCLRIYIMSEEGKDITLYRLHPGDMCMLAASCVIQAITFDVFIDAEEDSRCFVISGPAFASLSERNQTVKIFSLETAVERFSDVMWVMQQILFMSMDRRLAIFLTEESARLGTDTIELSHEQIARYMGSAREVVSRMLKYFVSEGIVELSRRGVKITDRKKLRKLAFEHS